MAGGVRLDRGGEHVEPGHGVVVAVEIVLHHFHRLKLLEACLFCNLVLAFVGIVLQMPHIGDVAHIAHLVAEVGEVTVDHIEGDGGACMAQMAVAVDCWAAHIHAHAAFVQRLEELFLACERVIYQQIVVVHRGKRW